MEVRPVETEWDILNQQVNNRCVRGCYKPAVKINMHEWLRKKKGLKTQMGIIVLQEEKTV